LRELRGGQVMQASEVDAIADGMGFVAE
jgi:hypothetical protein